MAAANSGRFFGTKPTGSSSSSPAAFSAASTASAVRLTQPQVSRSSLNWMAKLSREPSRAWEMYSSSFTQRSL